MKEILIIKRGNDILYEGPILEVPIKKDIIDLKSLEIFGDDDPCIIHQSFVIKELVTDLKDLFKKEDVLILSGSKYENELAFLNFEKTNTLSIELKR